MRDDVTIDEWVAALESGRYNHGKGRLFRRERRRRAEHCCLGVLLDLAGAKWKVAKEDGCTPGARRCVALGSTTDIPPGWRRLLGPEIEKALNRLVPNPHHGGKLMLAHDTLMNVNDLSEDGYVAAIKVLRQLQERVV